MRAIVYPRHHQFVIRVNGQEFNVPTISMVYDTLTPRGFAMTRIPFIWTTEEI